MMRNGFWPHAIGTHLSRPSWPVVLLVMAGLHLWLLVWARSLNPSPGTAAPLQSPQVRWLQAAVLTALEPKPQAAPKADAARSPPPRLQAPPQPQRPAHTTPLARVSQHTPDPVPLPAPLPRNDAPTPEAPTAPASPQSATPAAKDNPATPATSATSATPPAAPVRPVDAHQFGCDFPRPPYPRLARLNGESGTAVIHLTLAASGQIAAAVVERSSGSAALDAAALASARAGQCTPGASARLATVPFHFQLDP
jgi:protein TonB